MFKNLSGHIKVTISIMESNLETETEDDLFVTVLNIFDDKDLYRLQHNNKGYMTFSPIARIVYLGIWLYIQHMLKPKLTNLYK